MAKLIPSYSHIAMPLAHVAGALAACRSRSVPPTASAGPGSIGDARDSGKDSSSRGQQWLAAGGAGPNGRGGDDVVEKAMQEKKNVNPSRDFPSGGFASAERGSSTVSAAAR